MVAVTTAVVQILCRLLAHNLLRILCRAACPLPNHGICRDRHLVHLTYLITPLFVGVYFLCSRCIYWLPLFWVIVALTNCSLVALPSRRAWSFGHEPCRKGGPPSARSVFFSELYECNLASYCLILSTYQKK